MGIVKLISKFSDKYIVPEKLAAEYAEHLAQIKMRKKKKKEETERERMERLNREYNDIDWDRTSIRCIATVKQSKVSCKNKSYRLK